MSNRDRRMILNREQATKLRDRLSRLLMSTVGGNLTYSRIELSYLDEAGKAELTIQGLVSDSDSERGSGMTEQDMRDWGPGGNS